MGDTITAHEHIFRDITAPDGSSAQRELAYVPGDEIPAADAKALGVGSNGRVSAGSPEDKARRGPKSKQDDDAGDSGSKSKDAADAASKKE